MRVLRGLVGLLVVAALVVGGAQVMRATIFNVVAFTDSLPVFTGCQVLYSGASPYTPEATARIQAAIRARVPHYDFTFDQHRFAYPAHVCVLLAPFALWDYDAATPYWLLLNFVSFALLPVAFYRVAGARVAPLWLAGMVFVGLIGWRYSMIHIILGQFVFLVLWAMLGATAALRGGRDLLAGVCLACMTVRPEGFFLMLPLLGFALLRRRWRVLAGLLGTLAAFALVTFVLAGVWLGEFLQRLREYGSYRQQATLWLPSLLGAAGVLAAGGYLAALAWQARCRFAERHAVGRCGWALGALGIAQFLLLPQTNTYTLIYALPAFFWVVAQSKGARAAFVGATLAGIWMWQAWGTSAPFMLDALLLPLWVGLFLLAA